MTPKDIKKIRKFNGDTQKKFANRLGLSDYNTVSRWERGVTIPNPSALIMLMQLQEEMEKALNL